jgi:hypothetical protein
VAILKIYLDDDYLVNQFIREGERKYLSDLRIPCCKYAQAVDKGLSK